MPRLKDEQLQKVCGLKDVQGIDDYERNIAQAQFDQDEKDKEQAMKERTKEIIQLVTDYIPCMPDLYGVDCDQETGDCKICKHVLEITDPIKQKYLRE